MDISVQEVQAGGYIKHIHRANGGPWGGTRVDNNFLEWLANIFGTDSLNRFKTENMADYYELINNFEVKKRNIQPDETSNERLIIRLGLLENTNRQSLQKALDSLGLQDDVTVLRSNKIKISHAVCKSWFEDPIHQITCHLKTLIKDPKMIDVNLVMLVGGFSECKLIQSAIKSALKDKDVIIPEEAGLAVLRGAVRFGLQPTVITKRVMKLSYGMSKRVAFDQQLHDSSKAETDLKGNRFVRLFDTFVVKDSEVNVDDVVTRFVIPSEDLATKLKIYTSSNADTVYISDGCKKIGEIYVEHPEDRPRNEKQFKVHIEFAETEVFVRVERLFGGKSLQSRMNCL